MERLGHKALHAARAGNGFPILRGELVHAENGNDILQLIVALQYALHFLGGLVMPFADDVGREHARRGFQRRDGGVDAELDDAARKEMRARMEAGSDFENITLLVGFDNVIAIGLQMDEYRRFEGKSVAEIAQTLQKDPFDTLFDLLAAEQCNTGMIDYISDEEDVKDILRAPFSGVISDATYPSGGRVHPRVYGTFARLIEKYVVQERVLTLEQAVHKVTGHAADRFGFEKKGVIAAGMDADLLLFSPENIHEQGTYARPNLPATGFDEVFVLGERVIENGVYRGGSSGEMLGARMGY